MGLNKRYNLISLQYIYFTCRIKKSQIEIPRFSCLPPESRCDAHIRKIRQRQQFRESFFNKRKHNQAFHICVPCTVAVFFPHFSLRLPFARSTRYKSKTARFKLQSINDIEHVSFSFHWKSDDEIRCFYRKLSK